MRSLPRPVFTTIFICLFLSRSVMGQAADQPSSAASRVPVLDTHHIFLFLLITSALLGLATVLFIVLVNQGAGDRFLPYFGGGQLVQFVVILLIANNVLALALCGVFGASEVSAIYGGIIGYVLGRKTQEQNGNVGQPSQPPAAPDRPRVNPGQPGANPAQPSANPGDQHGSPDVEHQE
jgi:hypothetical protein